jgi:hypothetical protein
MLAIMPKYPAIDFSGMDEKDMIISKIKDSNKQQRHHHQRERALAQISTPMSTHSSPKQKPNNEAALKQLVHIDQMSNEPHCILTWPCLSV